jgi:hypothetical protein
MQPHTISENKAETVMLRLHDSLVVQAAQRHEAIPLQVAMSKAGEAWTGAPVWRFFALTGVNGRGVQ